MKIEKFNESVSKQYFICIITDGQGGVDFSGIFESDEDLDNWILNIINEMYLSRTSEEENVGPFIDVVEAINWAQEENTCDVYYINDIN